MANLPINSPAAFTLDVYKREKEDFITADLENQIAGQLLNNDAYLNQKVSEMALTTGAHETNTEIHVTQADKNAWNRDATTTAPGRMSAADKVKLNQVAAGAEVNQNAYGTVKAGGVAIAANSKTAQVEFVAGSNVTITGDNASKRVTVSANLPGTMPPSAHNQSANTITAGTFAGNVAVQAGTDYGVSKLRNIKMQSTAPASLANGEICLVYS